MEERNLGDLGEDALKCWASSRNITAQPPLKDRFGWDFLLELHTRWQTPLPWTIL
jgi:hypothetical protein